MQNILRLNEKDIVEAIANYYGVLPEAVVQIKEDDKYILEVEFTQEHIRDIFGV